MQIDLNEVECITETSLTIRGTRRRTTVPKEIVERLGLQNGNKVRWVLFNDGRILLMKVNKAPDESRQRGAGAGK